MKQTHREIPKREPLELTSDVSHANQKRYLRAMKGGRPWVVGRRLALQKGKSGE